METVTAFFFLSDGQVAPPGWVRSANFENLRHVRLFRSASLSNDALSLALGLLLTILVGVIAFLVRRYSAQLFTKPYDTIESSAAIGPL